MTPIITSLIPPRNFEVIRDQIALILITEIGNQYNIDSSNPKVYPNINKVWVERFIPFNSETELPTINVNIAQGSYDNQNIKKADGTYTYNIDIYTSAPSSLAAGPGDQYAMITMNKIAGMVWAILSNPNYYKPGNVFGLPAIISDAVVTRFMVLDKNSAQDALSDVVGRMQIMVKAIETTFLPNSENIISEATTTINLNGSSEGFYYDYNPVV